MTQEENLDRHRERLRWEIHPDIFCYELSDDDCWFPDPRMAIVPAEGENPEDTVDFDTLVAVGGSLSPERLEVAYSHGYFPWGEADDPEKCWHAPLMRFVLFPERVHISHSMRTMLNKGRYLVSINRAFPAVIRNCSEVDGRNKQEGYWLGEELITVFTELYRRGRAVSVEVWDSRPDAASEACPTAEEALDEHDRSEKEPEGVMPEKTWRLVGGLYGVLVNDSFMGDSMFSLVPSASKVALIGLAQWLRTKGEGLIDLQIRTEHLESMGGEYIDYPSFLKVVNPALYEANPGLAQHPCFSSFDRERIFCDPFMLDEEPSYQLLCIE